MMLDAIRQLISFALEMCVALAGPLGVLVVVVALAVGLFVPHSMERTKFFLSAITLVTLIVFCFFFTAISAGSAGQFQLHIAGWEYAQPAQRLIELEGLAELPKLERNRQLLDMAGDDEASVWSAKTLDIARAFALLTAAMVAAVVGTLISALASKLLK